MSRAVSPLCTTSARGTSSSAAPLALMTVPGGTYTPQQLLLMPNATMPPTRCVFENQDQLAKRTEGLFHQSNRSWLSLHVLLGWHTYYGPISSVTLPTVISNLSELQAVPWIQIGNSKVHFLVLCIETQSGNSKVRLQTFEQQVMLAYPLCNDLVQPSRGKLTKAAAAAGG